MKYDIKECRFCGRLYRSRSVSEATQDPTVCPRCNERADRNDHPEPKPVDADSQRARRFPSPFPRLTWSDKYQRFEMADIYDVTD